ncbi:hypothetical protein [Dechloromonas sp. HYN0024]|uniref:hypothetical protein n=1 Tax=Dechloromonas sp. HYN0024 TaxID=2231055 RepID=UPI000E433AEA|nr:hypothetical protein [Dechloromonas sp. HYN0024]AXS80465.1 hypothetical protein HYN24_10805 [Dechloromonas sp. HYN0024]
MIQGQYRYAILQSPEEVTPLKFRGHVRREIEAIQASAQHAEDIIIVRLFVLEKVLFALGSRKVDSLLHSIVAKCPNIQRIELEALLRPLSQDEMQEAAEEAQGMLLTLGDWVMASGATLGPASRAS